jgi:hypothetical protein
LSSRPPTEQELAATHDLLRAWEEVVAAGRHREGEVSFDSIAEDRGIFVWFAYWSPAASRWWDDDGSRSLGATGLSGGDDNLQFGWLVPQEVGETLLVVSVAANSPPRTGSATSEHPPGLAGFDALFTTVRGLPPDPAGELHKLVPWLADFDVKAMARLHSVPGCEDRGVDVRAVHIRNDDADEWFGYEVYPLDEPARRQNILGLIDPSPPVVFVRAS